MVTFNGKRIVPPQAANDPLLKEGMEHRDDLTFHAIRTTDRAPKTHQALNEIRCSASDCSDVFLYDKDGKVDLVECEVQDALIMLHNVLHALPPAYRDDARRALQFLSSRLLEESLHSVLYRLSNKADLVQHALTFVHDVFQVCLGDHKEDWCPIDKALVVLKTHFLGNANNLMVATDFGDIHDGVAIVSPESCGDGIDELQESTRDCFTKQEVSRDGDSSPCPNFHETRRNSFFQGCEQHCHDE